MTREQIKKKVADIIHDVRVTYTEEGYILYDDAMDAAEEIMKIWDRGYTYEVPEADDAYWQQDCCKNGVCTCGS